MPQDIFVVEYEPRYTERVRQALSGQPFNPLFAKDGEEALRVLEGAVPNLIVLSSVIPRISTTELIRMIRTRPQLVQTPILVTVSGYNGKAPKQDAGKIGASDILPKPYSEAEFLGKVQSMLGVKSEQAVPAGGWASDVGREFIVHQGKPAIPDAMKAGQANALTSNEIFGDIFEDDKPAAPVAPAAPATATPASRQQDNLDRILAETLSGVRVPGRKKAEPAKADTAKVPTIPEAKPAASTASAEAKAKSSADLDRLLEDTLSGLEKSLKFRTGEQPKPAPTAPPPAAIQPPPPAAAAPPVAEIKPAPSSVAPKLGEEKVPLASPVIPPPAPEKPKEKTEVDDANGIRFGQYLLTERIATGGMAEVWKARMRGVEGFQKIVAIKKILPHLSDNEEFVTMFIDEAKLAAQLNHNNIIHIYDLGKIANSYYIAMEYIDGHDLKTILKRGEERGQPMPVDLAIYVASKIASALDYAHRKRDLDEKDMVLVHRDVSPQNVLISHEGDIKLCDFGIAKAASKASHTQAGALKGKLQYMSPEQAWGKKIDRRSDIFALAAVLFELLTGRKLFMGDNEISILEQVREAKVLPPSELNDEVTPEIDAIVLKALKKDPDDRYETAGEMGRDLDAVLYSFRPTPTSADLAIHMHRLYSAEPVPVVSHVSFMEAPEEEANVVSIKPAAFAPVAPVAPAPAPIGPMFGARIEEEKREKKLPLVPIAIGAVVVVAIAIGGYLAMRGKSSAPAAPAAVTTAAATPIPAVVPSATSPTTAIPTATTATAPDQASVDQEVKKRLEAERLKLEQQRAQLAQSPTATQAPAPQPTPTATQASAPTPQPVPVQAAPSPQPAVVTRPEPPPTAPAQPQAPQVKEGDLVPAGTLGLVPPEIVSLYKPPYPQIAQAQRLEGVVIISALVSETGRVLNATVVRGVPQLNDAALQAVRRSTFRPATLNGVRVKTYKTVIVPFKLVAAPSKL